MPNEEVSSETLPPPIAGVVVADAEALLTRTPPKITIASDSPNRVLFNILLFKKFFILLKSGRR
jgi:hypothetical protein